MYLVVYSFKTHDVCTDGIDFVSHDRWSAYETYGDALKEYKRVLLFNDLYSVSIAGVLRSTDYESIKEVSE
tara:strand:- start:309 stop:521 length:213 start_codon:yes stop_codon:yes gene_type:complete